MDQSVFYFVNGLAGRWQWLDWLGIFCASYLEYILIGGAIVLAFWPLEHIRRDKKVGRVALLAAGGSYLVFKIFLPFFLERARPFIQLPDAVRLIDANSLEYYRSFPSGHAVVAFALAYAIWLYDKTLGRWFLAAAVLVALGRVFVGVHWPSDVIAGAVFGILGATVARWKMNRYQKFWSRFLS